MPVLSKGTILPEKRNDCKPESQVLDKKKPPIGGINFTNTVVTTLRNKNGAGRIRTDDLLRAREALSQLSHSPMIFREITLIIFKKPQVSPECNLMPGFPQHQKFYGGSWWIRTTDLILIRDAL
jgi:hypothetical protein